MIFVMDHKEVIFYLSLMLLLSRDHIYLQVYHAGPEGQITPPMGQFERAHYIYTYAQGEERLAQYFLATATLWNPRVQLRDFFMQQGWQVQEVEGTAY